MSKIAEISARRNIAKDVLAKKLGVSVDLLSRWEKDSKGIRGDKLVELADLLECSVDEILGLTT